MQRKKKRSAMAEAVIDSSSGSSGEELSYGGGGRTCSSCVPSSTSHFSPPISPLSPSPRSSLLSSSSSSSSFSSSSSSFSFFPYFNLFFLLFTLMVSTYLSSPAYAWGYRPHWVPSGRRPRYGPGRQRSATGDLHRAVLQNNATLTCLSVRKTSVGSQLVLTSCIGARKQRWTTRFPSGLPWKNEDTGTCMSIKDGHPKKGGGVVLAYCHDDGEGAKDEALNDGCVAENGSLVSMPTPVDGKEQLWVQVPKPFNDEAHTAMWFEVQTSLNDKLCLSYTRDRKVTVAVLAACSDDSGESEPTYWRWLTDE